MKVFFNQESVTRRGDKNFMRYTRGLKKYYEDFDFTLVYPTQSANIEQEIIEELTHYGAKILPYANTSDLLLQTKEWGYNYTYHMCAGGYIGKLFPHTQNIIHCVFNYVCPHGDIYAYNSSTLAADASEIMRSNLLSYLAENKTNVGFDAPGFAAKYMSPVQSSQPRRMEDSWRKFDYANGFPYVPHVIDLPNPSMSKGQLAQTYGFNPNCKLVSRIGGKTEFNILDIQSEVAKVSAIRTDVQFLFVNTNRFPGSERCIFIDEYITEDVKSSIIEASDVMIHARWLGESFGFSILESMIHGTPILASALKTPHGRNHIDLLEKYGLIYTSASSFTEKLEAILDAGYVGCDHLVEEAMQYTEEPVTELFVKTFLTHGLNHSPIDSPSPISWGVPDYSLLTKAR